MRSIGQSTTWFTLYILTSFSHHLFSSFFPDLADHLVIISSHPINSTGKCLNLKHMCTKISAKVNVRTVFFVSSQLCFIHFSQSNHFIFLFGAQNKLQQSQIKHNSTCFSFFPHFWHSLSNLSLKLSFSFCWCYMTLRSYFADKWITYRFIFIYSSPHRFNISFV